MSSSSASTVTGPSRLSTDTVLATSSDTVEAVARRETPPVQSPVAYTESHDQQGAPPFLKAHRLSCDTTSAPPPYSPESYVGTAMEKQKEVDFDKEPPTLARLLFIYGFLFFPFWLAGIYILCSPLLPTPDWEAGKTEEEKAQRLQLLRKTELKWARRCLCAMFGLLVTIFLLVVIIKFGIMRPI